VVALVSLVEGEVSGKRGEPHPTLRRRSQCGQADAVRMTRLARVHAYSITNAAPAVVAISAAVSRA
jgi:hypothetical protein